MTPQEQWQLRLSVLSDLVARAKTKLGRTAIMKLAYFLQTLRGVPLDYHFRLYTYGPFDSDVLDDVGRLESLGAVKSQLVIYPSGYGYNFSPGAKREKVEKLTGRASSAYQNELTWVLDEFGGYSAADLELLSTIVFAKQEAVQKGESITHRELARIVGEIKPRFEVSYIMQTIAKLDAKGLLTSGQR